MNCCNRPPGLRIHVKRLCPALAALVVLFPTPAESFQAAHLAKLDDRCLFHSRIKNCQAHAYANVLVGRSAANGRDEEVSLNGKAPVSTVRMVVDKADKSDGGLSLPYSEEIANVIDSPPVEILDTALILLSAVLFAFGTLPASSLPEGFVSFDLFLEDVILYTFCIGFFLRWYGVGHCRPQYFADPLAVIDFGVSVVPLVLMNLSPVLGLTDVPSWMVANSGLLDLRLLRMLRLQRVLVDVDTFSRFEVALGLRPQDVRPWQLQLARVLVTVLTLLTIATGLIYTAEHDVNPMIPDFFTALYFGLTTLTTVGFGDIAPVTVQGKLVVMGSILFGVTVIPSQAANLVKSMLDFQAERERKRERKELQRDFSTKVEYQTVDPRISCHKCGVRSHRPDAVFCWKCGSDLREVR